MASRQKLRVLCFGDSLTAGFAEMGAVYHPYRLKLEQMLEMAFPDIDIETDDDGEPGDTVKFGFLSRMQQNCWFFPSLRSCAMCAAILPETDSSAFLQILRRGRKETSHTTGLLYWAGQSEFIVIPLLPSPSASHAAGLTTDRKQRHSGGCKTRRDLCEASGSLGHSAPAQK